MAKAFYEIWKTDSSYREDIQEIKFKEVNVKKKMMGVSSFYFNINRDAETALSAPATGDYIKIIRNNEEILRGQIEEMDTRDLSIHYEGFSVAYDWKQVLNGNYVWKNTGVRNAIQTYASAIGWTIGTVDNPALYNHAYPYVPLIEELELFSNINDREFYFDEVNKQVHFKAEVGEDKTTEVRFIRGVNIESFGVKREKGETWKQVIALGAGEGSNQLKVVVGDGSDKHSVRVFTDKQIKDRTELTNYANSKLKEGEGQELVTYEAKILSPLFAVDIGDKVWIEDDLNRIDEAMRIMEVEYSFNETEQFNVTFANKNKTLADLFKKMERGQRTLNNVHHSSAVQPNSMIQVDDEKNPIRMEVENGNFVNTTTGNDLGTIENNVNTAQSTASSAQADASNALTTSGLASEVANQAKTDAQTAQSKADQASADAQTAITNANNAQAVADSAQEDASNALTTANNVNSTVADLSSDSKLTPSEKQMLKKEMDTITAEKASIEAQGTAYGLTTEKNNYTTGYNNLNSFMSPLLTDLNTTSNVTGSTMRTRFKDYYTYKTTLLNKVADITKGVADTAKSTADTAKANADQAQADASSAVTTANNADGKADSAITTANNADAVAQQAQADADSATTVANNAKTTADNAKATADGANNLVADLSSDSKLTPSEKQMIKKEWDAIVAEKTSIEAQGTAYGITTEKTAYTDAYNTLSSFLSAPLADLTVTSNVTGSTMRTNFKNYYSAKTTLLNKVADVTKGIADTAQSKADTAKTTADNAKSTADSASSTASSANTKAGQAQTDASNAVTTANNANTSAENAVSTAQQAQADANTAKTTANTAKSTADSAKASADASSALVSDMSNDNKITPVEKQELKKEWDIIVSEKPTLESQATTYGISTEKTNYTNAYNSLSSYVSPLLTSLTTTSDITGTTLRSRFKTYYDSKLALLNKVADIAKAKADTAQAKADQADGKADELTISKVEKNGVISAINQSPESVTIDASQVNLVGYTTFKSQSEISGNLMKDHSSFESYAVGHNFPQSISSGLSVKEVSNEFAYHGAKSIKTYNTSTNSYIYPNYTHSELPKLEVGKKYIASVYVYTTSANPVTVQWSPQIRDSAGTSVGSDYKTKTITKVDGWVRLFGTLAPTQAGDYTFQYYLRTVDPANVEVYWDAIQLEEVPSEVNYPSPYRDGGFTTIDGDVIQTGTLKWDKGFGGQLALGGLNNENGQLVILNDEGDPIAYLGAGTAGFGEIQADQLIGVKNLAYKTSPLHPCYEDGKLLIYVNGITGRNDAVGTKDDPFLSIQDAIDSVPNVLEHDAEIRIFPMKYDETISIRGFIGEGTLILKTHMWGVQYIRDWSNGSTSNTGNHWVEIQAYSAYTGNNMAQGKTVTTSGTANSSYPLSRIVDGNTDTGQYADAGSGSSRYVEIDMHTEYDLDNIKVWKYYSDRRSYMGMQTFVKGSGTNNQWIKIWDVDNWTGRYQESSLGTDRQVFINGYINVASCDKVNFYNLTVDARAYGTNAPIWFYYNRYNFVENVTTFTESASYCFYNYGSFVRLQGCEGNGAKTAVICSAYGARTDLFTGNRGQADSMGLFAYSTGSIAGSGSAPNGKNTVQSASNGGDIRVTFSGADGAYTPYTAPPPPPPPKDVIKTFTSTSSKSWRENYGGQWYDSTVLQGEWDGWGLYRGYWFFGNAISDAVQGKTIKKVRVYLTRSNSSGNSGTVNAALRCHSYSSQPSSTSTPSYYGSNYQYAGFSWGEGKWVDVTSKFASYFNAGVKGIMLYTSSRSNSDYMRFSGTAKIEITYQA